VALWASTHRGAGGGVAAGALAYGGADLPLMLDKLLARSAAPATLRRAAAHWAAWMLEAYAPERHLPRFAGALLLVEADGEDLLPASSLAAMRAAASANTEVRVQEGKHITGSAREIVRQTVRTIRDWLSGLGLLRPDELAAAPACPAN